MDTTYRVTEVTERPGVRLAELVGVEWYKTNPAFTAMMDEYDALIEEVGQEAADARPAGAEYIEETIPAEPGEEGAESIETRSYLTLDITDGPDLHPLDNVRLTVEVVARVNA